MALLVETWVSKANATQRKGRAGRVSEGQCFRLCSRPKWNTLPDHQLPEIRRTPLDHVCLQIKLLKLDSKYASPNFIMLVCTTI
jgi:HrpA-like RNA helicase